MHKTFQPQTHKINQKIKITYNNVLETRTMAKTRRGDLLQLALDGEFDVIVHGQNCHHDWGMGIVTSIRTLFPEAYVADKVTAKSDLDKLGTISFATVERPNGLITIVNGYTQFDYKAAKGVVLADYDAIRSVFAAVKEQFPGQRIGYIGIGAGFARGDWSIIKNIIDEELHGEDHTFVEKDVTAITPSQSSSKQSKKAKAPIRGKR